MSKDHKFDALESVRRLIRTGNNKSYWRRREREILAERAAQPPERTDDETAR